MGVNATEKEIGKEKVLLVGVATPGVTNRLAREHLAELGRLAYTAGAEVVETVLQRRPGFDAATLIGQGKAREIAELVKKLGIGIVLFDEELTGSQAKKLETIIPGKIMDRSAIILDIFAKHARTAESRIQVEVAQLEYMMPRLTRAWTHLCRQVGGIGTRGPGETQLEVDRRTIRRRIADLSKRLEKLEAIREAQHKRREDLFHVALVGYTNAGKSTLMNALTRAGVLAEDKLFATLDSTTRKLYLGGQHYAVLSDTVGFIRKLPPGLVASFRSTLGVACQASMILNVVDASAEDFMEQMETTAQVLKDLGTEHIPQVLIFNKIDAMEPMAEDMLRERFPEALLVSALEKRGLDELKDRIVEFSRIARTMPWRQDEPAPVFSESQA